MPDSKITALTSISTSTDPANDPLVIVDVSDTSMAATGTTKKVTLNQLLGASGTATLASATISGDLTVDTNTLKVDSANDRVGIGIATPAWPLDIRSATAVAQILSTTGTNAAYLQVSNTGGIFYLGRENSAGTSFASPAYSAVLYAGGAYPLVTTVNGSERYRIASDGVATWSNVGGGAGTAMTLNSTGLGVGVSPSYNLDVRAAAAVANVQSSTGTNAVSIVARNTGGSFTVGKENSVGGGSGVFGQDAYASVLWSTGAYPIAFGTNGAQRMLIDASGNVGVGRSPSYRLQASSGTKATTASLATVAGITTTDADDFGIYFRLKTDATGANRYAAITSFDNGSGNGARDLVLQDLGGNVGIGVTPAAKLHVEGSGPQARFSVATAVDARHEYYRNGIREGLLYWDANLIGLYATQSSGELVLASANTIRVRINSAGDTISNVTATPPTLSTNRQMVFNLTSDTNLRISVRGTDGTTRTANITLA